MDSQPQDGNGALRHIPVVDYNMIPSIDTLKSQGRLLHKELLVLDPNVTYTHALHALAKHYGLPNWQTLRAKAPTSGPKLGFEDRLPYLEAHGFTLLWENIGEGWEGDYDPTDPKDTPLLRFSLYRYVKGATNDREELDDCSYCTQMPATTSQLTLTDALLRMWGYLEEELLRPYPQPKRLCQRLSWVGPNRESWPELFGYTD